MRRKKNSATDMRFKNYRLQFFSAIFFLFFGVILLFVFEYLNETLRKADRTGVVTLVTRNNANSYYLYNEEPMGFEYDLAKAFADHFGWDLKILIPEWDELLNTVISGNGDFIAASLTITEGREEVIDFSNSYMTIRQHIILHKCNREVKELMDLIGMTVHVRKGSSYHNRILALNEEGMGINLVLHKNTPTEELIRSVAEKEFDITVADSNIALLNRRHYPVIKISFPINGEEYLGWGVRKGETRFLGKINEFINVSKENGTYDRIYEKYYSDIEKFDYIDLKKFHERISSRLPKYEKVIRNIAEAYDFDWRLIAAVVYQESHFNPWAKSPTGVRGLMQMTLPTAGEMGINNRLDPEESIRGGVQYLSKMYSKFDDIKDEHERILFSLASYNIGYGHVRDAQKIAQEKGMGINKWRSLKQTLPLLRKRKYYKSTKYGYARGTEPVRYIERVLIYYDILKRRDFDT